MQYNFPPILRLPTILEITQVSRSTIYQWCAEGRFPKPYSLGSRSVGWRSADVQAWLESRQPTKGA